VLTIPTIKLVKMLLPNGDLELKEERVWSIEMLQISQEVDNINSKV